MMTSVYRTALHYAAYSNAGFVVELLLDNYAELEVRLRPRVQHMQPLSTRCRWQLLHVFHIHEPMHR
jgi:hypothetical protein